LKLRVAQIALVINALLASTAAVGLLIGRLPHADESPLLARMAGARELSGVIILLLVASRLRRDPWLILFALIFVGCNLANSVAEFVVSRDPRGLAPLTVEAIFFTTYAAFFANRPAGEPSTS
jgi:hypothetical protein